MLSLRGDKVYVMAVAWSPDAKLLATSGSDGKTRVWDVETGRELLTLRGNYSVVDSVAWSPDGKRLVIGHWDNSAKLWDANTGKELMTLHGHKSFVLSVAWSPDGKACNRESRRHSKDMGCRNGTKLLRVLQEREFERLGSSHMDGVLKQPT
jgi:WD40 repeat protein